MYYCLIQVHEIVKSLEALRQQEARSEWTAEQKERNRELSRIRMARKRARDKEKKEEDHNKENSEKNPSKKVTSTSEQREYWKVKRRESRERRSAQKIRRDRERNTNQRQTARESVREATPCTPRSKSRCDSDQEDEASETSVMSPNAIRVAAHRAIQGRMPQKPSAFAKVIRHIIENASPRKKNALKQEGVSLVFSKQVSDTRANHIMHQLDQRIEKLKKEKTDTSTLEKRYLASLFGENSGIDRKTLWRIQKKSVPLLTTSQFRKRKLKFSNIVRKRVEDTFQYGSVTFPDKKLVSKKSKRPRQVLNRTITQLYCDFKKKYPGINISRSTFSSLRPKHIKLMKFNKRNSCLCEYCENINLKLKACNKFPSFPYSNKFLLNSDSLCEHTGQFPAVKCIDRKCSECGIQKVSEKMSKFMANYGTENVTYEVWGRVKYEHKAIFKTKLAEVTKTTSVRQLISELLKDLVKFAKHVFIWEWQNLQFKEAQEKLPRGVLLTVMDFQQNYTCEGQDQAQSAHWAQQQVALHPTVSWYRCMEHDKIVKESIIHISEDLLHDYHAVHHFEKEIVEHMKSRNINVVKQVQFTDGCGYQYKSKGPFTDISNAEVELGHTVQRNFFGSRHGKGPSDGEGE